MNKSSDNPLSQTKLRFRHTNGANFPSWDEKKLGELNIFVSDGNYGEMYPKASEMKDSGIPFIRANNIKNLRIVWNDMKYISEELHSVLQSGHLETGDILITTRGEIGMLGYVSEEFNNSNINAQICLLRVGNNLSSKYLLYYLSSRYGRKQFKELQTGSALKQLPKGNLNKVRIPYPSLLEQQKIASFLSSIDDWIENLTQQKVALEKYKKGMMQKIFSQEIRFKDENGKDFPDWEQKTLGDAVVVSMGQSPNSNAYNLEGNGLPLIQGNADIQNRKTAPRIWTTDITKTCDIEDIILTVRAPSGYVATSYHKACIGRGVCALKPKKGISKNFIFQFLLYFEPRWIRIEQGSTFSAISGDDIRGLKIKLPELNEQQKIADFLTYIHELIETKDLQITNAQQWKKGLMQKLFI